MASIVREFTVELPADAAWACLRDFGRLHERLARGFVTACDLEEGGAVRHITFANGMRVRERLVSCDEAQRRLVYTAEGGRASHHNASAQIVEDRDDRCRFIWITDLLPDALAPAIGQMMDAGAAAMKACLEAQPG